jgi:hypothetical protein
MQVCVSSNIFFMKSATRDGTSGDGLVRWRVASGAGGEELQLSFRAADGNSWSDWSKPILTSIQIDDVQFSANDSYIAVTVGTGSTGVELPLLKRGANASYVKMDLDLSDVLLKKIGSQEQLPSNIDKTNNWAWGWPTDARLICGFSFRWYENPGMTQKWEVWTSEYDVSNGEIITLVKEPDSTAKTS